MNSLIALNRKSIFILAGVLLTSILFLDHYIYAFAAIFLITVLALNRKRHFIIFTVLFLLLTLVGEISPVLRIIIQIFSYGTLLVLFFKDFGLKFRNYPVPPAPLIIFIFLLFLVMLLSSAFSGYLSNGLLVIGYTYIVFVLIYILFSVINSDKTVAAVFIALLLSASVMSVSIIYIFLNSDFNLITLFAITNIRVSGLLSNFNALSVFFAITIPVLCGMLFIYKERSYKSVIVAFLILLSFGLILTGSRASITSIIVALVFTYAFLHTKILKTGLVILVTLVLGYYLIPVVNENLTLLFRVEEGLNQRDSLWAMSTRMIEDNFFTGIGPGTYGIKMYDYFPVLIESYTGQSIRGLTEMAGTITNLSHNFYLAFFSELGILGLLLSLSLPLIFMSIGIKTIKRYKNTNRENYIISVVLTGTGLGMFVRAMFEGINIISFGWITADIPFWLTFIVLLYIQKQPLTIWGAEKNI